MPCNAAARLRHAVGFRGAAAFPCNLESLKQSACSRRFTGCFRLIKSFLFSSSHHPNYLSQQRDYYTKKDSNGGMQTDLEGGDLASCWEFPIHLCFPISPPQLHKGVRSPTHAAGMGGNGDALCPILNPIGHCMGSEFSPTPSTTHVTWSALTIITSH